MDRRDVEAQIIELAADPEYRARLLADPKATVAETLGAPIPDELDLKVQEEQPGQVILVLPAVTSGEGVSDAELAGTAGGWGKTNFPCTMGICSPNA